MITWFDWKPDHLIMWIQNQVWVGWLAPLKTEKKLKGRFISIRNLLVIEIGIFLTWDNFRGYVLFKTNLALLWQCQVKFSCQLKRALCSFQNLLLQIFEYGCRVFHATDTDLKTESADFSKNLQINFLKRNFIVQNWKQSSRCFFFRLLEVLVLST